MTEALIALSICFCLAAAALGSLVFYERLPDHNRQEDTHRIVSLSTNLFVVMTSLVIGLMISSAKNVFETVDHNVHAFATDLIVLDRMLRQYGPDAEHARQNLITYTRRASDGRGNESDKPLVTDRASEQLLDAVGNGLRVIKPPDSRLTDLLHDAEQQFRKVSEMRWVLLEQAEGTIPVPLIVLLVIWLVLIFASFGYRAPRNPVVVITFVLSAALVSGALYLIIDMDGPLNGPIQISPAPLQRALAEMEI